MVVAILWALSGYKESWGIASLFIFLVVASLYVRLRPDLETLAIGFAGWVGIGVVYSFWRWFWQIRKLRQRVDEAMAKEPDPDGYFEPNLHRCDLKNIRRAKTVAGFKPEFRYYRGLVAIWTSLWPVFLLKDLTVDLIESIQDALKNLYQHVADKAYGN
jgi:hypothetical protein